MIIIVITKTKQMIVSLKVENSVFPDSNFLSCFFCWRLKIVNFREHVIYKLILVSMFFNCVLFSLNILFIIHLRKRVSMKPWLGVEGKV